MDHEKRQEAIVLAEVIGTEIGKVLEKFNKRDNVKDHLEKNEYRNKELLYFINISAIISYIAGALVMQLPFWDKIGIIFYDFKLYLVIGAIAFVLIQSALFISAIYEIIASEISNSIENWLHKKLNNYNFDKIHVIIRIFVFIPLLLSLIELCRHWLHTYLPDNYYNLVPTLMLFFSIYTPLSLILQDKRFGSNMNTNNFIIVILALAISVYAGRSSFEQYLLTDAKLINNGKEKSIEVIQIDDKAIYYKENNKYKYEVLEDDAIIEFYH